MGGPTTFRLVEQVLESIDQPTAAPIALVTMVYPLQRAQAHDVANTINNLFRDRRDGIDPPRAEANASTNTVLVRGTDAQQQEIKEKVIDKLEEYAQTPAVPLVEKTFALKHIKADDTAVTLRQWFTDRQTALKAASPQGALNPADTTVSVTPMVESNELVVLASQENLQRIEARLAELDQEGVGAMSARVSRMYLMKYLDPGQFAQAVNTAFQKSGRVAEKDQVSTTVIASTQSVVVTASEENQEKIRVLLEQMDVDTAATARRTRRIELKEANSDELAQKLTPLFRESITTRRGDKPIQIVSEPKTNSLLVYANDQEFDQIQTVIQSVDVKTDPERDRVFKTFKLTYGEAWGVVQMINQIFQGSRNPRDQVTASADWGSNSLLVTASPENMKRVEDIIAEVDKKDASQRTVRVVELAHADPAGVVRALNAAFQSQGRRGETISISHAEGTNTLLIKANDTEFEEIQAVLAQLDTAEAELGEIRTFTLKFTDAAEMKQILESYLQRPGGQARGGAQLAGDIRISVSSQTNSLIVSGDREEVDRLAGVIEKIDVEVTDAGTAPKILVLQHALPSVLEPTLSKMFVEGAGKGGHGVRGGPASIVPVIVPDDTSKSLIVRANPVDFNQIKDLVDRLDTEDSAGEGGFKIIQLQAGVNVVEMADTLQGLLDEAARFEAEQRPGVKPQRVAIRADTRTNSILVAGARSRFTQVEDLVHRLERMGPLGGRTTVVVPTRNVDPDEIQAVIDRMIQENRGEGSTKRGGSQPRRSRQR
jgi:type II secretory pathway component GspD/PulD (secretin)